ncbi:MAG: tetratricopeptide repeat protein [Candidatus Krumholzibacteriaceae bacterium]|jgi:tetratricopeptide (TPR) repeat protein
MKHGTLIVLIAALLAPISGCGGDKALKCYNLGLDAIQRNDYDEAISLWTESLKYRPDDPETRYNLGAALMEKKRFAEAEIHLAKAVELDPLDPDTQYLFGQCEQELGKTPEAKHAYEFALNVKPTHVPSLVGLASIALKEGQNKSAENYATQAAEMDPNNLQANLLLSEAYFQNGNLSMAYGQLLSARRLGPTDPELLFLLGKVDYARRMYADARETLDAARTLGKSTDELYYYLALTNLALGDAPEAEKYFHLSIYKNDAYAQAWKGLAETYIGEKRWREAADAVAKALSLDPNDPGTTLDNAVVTLNFGDPVAAVRMLEALSQRPDAPQITGYYLGHAYLRTQRNADARAAFEQFAKVWEGDAAFADEARAIAARLAP